MKYFRKLFVCVIICAIILTMQTGCRKKSTDQSLGQTGAVGDITSENTGLGSIPEPINEAFKNVVIDHTFALSDGIDENGFWEGIRALDYVELFDYQDIQIDAQAVNVSEEEMEEEILLYLNNYPDQEIIMDREVVEGDLVNIDYVGSVDGVELENLSTKGLGTDEVAGSMDYIDDFLAKIIGHMPGETFNVEVTYPEDFGKEELNGKNAVFVTTINYIIEETTPELNDDFVKRNLSELFGWTTQEEMREGIRIDILNMNVYTTLFQFFTTQIPVRYVPQQLLDYQLQALFVKFEREAAAYGMTLEEYIGGNLDDVANNYYSDIYTNAVYYLVNQAIAEDVGLSVSEADLKQYAAENMGAEDYSDMAESLGLPYLKQIVLCQKVADYIMDNAELI